MTNFGIYVHIPFCLKKCPYCDFYSVEGNEDIYALYTSSLIDYIRNSNYSGSADTLYFGGGTPNLIGADRLNKILFEVDKKFSLSKNSEITLEANPGSISQQHLNSLFSNGFNRISFGIQSTQQKNLKNLGRLHDNKQAFEAIYMAERAGFKNISADLMLGVPEQTIEDCINSAEEICTLPIQHISAYMLKLEENTPFYKRYNQLDDDLLCDCYEAFSEALDKHNFNQYEISNYSKEGYQSRHNIKYWTLKPYVGFGASAHSFDGEKRSFYPKDISSFLSGKLESVYDSKGGDWEEYLMLGLRLSSGVDINKLPLKITIKIEKFVKAGLATIEGDMFSLTRKGFLLSNSIISDLIV